MLRIEFVKYVLILGALVLFMRTQIFTSWLIGGASLMQNFNTTISGQVGPEVLFFLLCAVIVIIIAIYSVWI